MSDVFNKREERCTGGEAKEGASMLGWSGEGWVGPELGPI